MNRPSRSLGAVPFLAALAAHPVMAQASRLGREAESVRTFLGAGA